MQRKVLIISPYFTPVNTADMQRVRMSLPYFAQFGWDAEVVAVEPQLTGLPADQLLVQSLPQNVVVHHVKAFDKKWTSKVGLGSLALRSMWYYRQKVDQFLRQTTYDLIYFSTTQFPLCVLGAYWKSKFKVPYVIDMQDPWHSEYYQDKPNNERPPKYWFSYRLNKYLEPKAMNFADGLISVSQGYIDTLKQRYSQLRKKPSAVITFGFFEKDFDIASDNGHLFQNILTADKINIVYVGRGGTDMHKAIRPVFQALKQGLEENPDKFQNLHFCFLGTSYAPAGQGKETIMPLAKAIGVAERVTEITDRISFYDTLATLQQADALFVPGSDDPQYTASKLYPYLLTKKPLLSVFNANSNAVDIIKECTVNAHPLTFPDDHIQQKAFDVLTNWANGRFEQIELTGSINNYSAERMAQKQTLLFEEVINQQ